MNHRDSMCWMSRLAVAGVLAWPVLGASGQTQVVTDAETLDTGLSQTVVVTQRPLRTFRGETVRVGRYAEAERAIGVVRPLREVPSIHGIRDTRYRSYDAHGRPTRVYVDSYLRSPRYEREIGVVRPFVTYDPPVRNLPRSFTNPNAPVPGNANAALGSASGDESRGVLPSASDARPVLFDDVQVTAVEAVELPAEHHDDPWALLDQGYYREARQRFAQLGTLGDTDLRTGHALAAALSGDLVGGAALMPAEPALPAGVVLNAATTQRLEQVARYLYEDTPAMQAAIRTIIDSGSSATASAE
ncbi:MAG: hypothetical protein AAGF84_14075 [Planctomycetota bacterium]